MPGIMTPERRLKISLTLMGRETKPAIERFMEKVSIAENGCWLWTGAIKQNGYGFFGIKKNCQQKMHNAHRWIYEYHNGPIPDGLTIDHLCRTRNCVNPQHMEPVSITTNILRGSGPSAINAKKTTCPKGHPLVPQPTNVRSRYCPICSVGNAMNWNKANRERKNENNRRYAANKRARELSAPVSIDVAGA
jgi:hypothetical protein